MKNPPKYLSTPHWPWSEKVHRDDSYHQDPEFFLNKEVVITEKIDGGNTCLWNGSTYARSTTQPANDGWFAMVKKHHAWKTVNMEAPVFYGEDIYGVHSIEYDAVYEQETFYLFAVVADDMFVHWGEVEFWAEAIPFPCAHVVFRGEFRTVEQITKLFQDERKQPSFLGGEREGFVMRTVPEFPAKKFDQHVCKFVRANHVQTDQHWRKNWKPCKIKGRK